MTRHIMLVEIENALHEGRCDDAGILLAQYIMEEMTDAIEGLDSGQIDEFVEGFKGELP